MCPLRILLALLQLHLLVIFGSAAPAAANSNKASAAVCPFRRAACAGPAPSRSPFSAFVTPPAAFREAAASMPSRVAPRAMKRQRVEGRPLNPIRINVLPTVERPLTRMASAVAEPPAKAAAQQQDPEKSESRKRKAAGPLEVHVIGLSHHNAAVEVREKLSIPEANWNAASSALCESGVISEATVLSTCNRFEVYFAAQDSYAAFHEAMRYLERHSGLPQSVLRRNLFLLSGEDAIWHLLRVSSGLDSLVVGEGQILSQVKQCYNHGIEEDGSAGKVVSRMLNSAVAAGKRVRTETGISRGAVSISSAAVEFSQYRCPKDLGKEFEDSKIAIIGAGKMSRLLMVHMASQGVKRITLMNRGRERAEALAAEFPEMEVDIKLMDELWPVVKSHEVIYTSTSSEGYLLTKDLMLEHGVQNKMVLVDISVPRNVEQVVSDLDGVFAYNVDNLKEVVDRNTAMRKKQIIEAEDLLMEELSKFRSWQFSLGAIPAITRLQEKAEAMRLEEMKKATKKLNKLSDKELETVERLTKGIVNKLLHGPMSHLRATENLEKNLAALKTLKAVFEI